MQEGKEKSSIHLKMYVNESVLMGWLCMRSVYMYTHT